MQLGRRSPRLNSPQQPRLPLSKYPCQHDVLWFHGDNDREEGEQDRSALNGRNIAWEDPIHDLECAREQLSSWKLWKARVHICLFTCAFSRSLHIPLHTNYLYLCVSQSFFGCWFRALPCWQQALRPELPILELHFCTDASRPGHCLSGRKVSGSPVTQEQPRRQKRMLPAAEVKGLMLEPCTVHT